MSDLVSKLNVVEMADVCRRNDYRRCVMLPFVEMRKQPRMRFNGKMQNFKFKAGDKKKLKQKNEK